MYNSDIFSRCEGRLQSKETMESSSVCLSVAGYCNSVSIGHSLLTQQRAADGPEASTGHTGNVQSNPSSHTLVLFNEVVV